MSILCENLKLRSKDVDMFRRLRSSELFKLLQEAAIRHTEELGMGREKTLDKGILWVVLMQKAEIIRMPVYDEEILLKSWPGKTMHLLFPRYYSLETTEGETLVRASAIWCPVPSGAWWTQRRGKWFSRRATALRSRELSPVQKLICPAGSGNRMEIGRGILPSPTVL